MSIISPQDVKKLREETNAGFGDCKKALSVAGGDFELAKKKLREMGIASAEKRLDRDAKEGRVFSYSNNIYAGLLLVSCETDFVALNHNFVNFGNSLIKELVESGIDSLTTSQELELKNLAATIKENIQVKKIFITKIQSNEFVKIYLHGEQSKIGVLVKLKVNDFSKTEDKIFQNFAMDLALHVAAFAPVYLRNDDVCPNYIKEQEEIFTKQLESSGKPESIIKGIVAGKIKKHLAEISLLEQSFVKNDKITVKEMLEEISKAISSKVEMVEFKYLRIG
ncbi:translation elongation factor Ts [Borreliella burgdorferi]|uniref:translation elongation factor Ts n=1 Tax=Borreliella burgdorferi TaxID=139 RepID=UPI00016B2DDF|nr:translation elongation factor Ts [Borreliella burgdorferi]AGS66145.1 elongation factor Ts [Borreliella burgdorferi CA382]EEF56502.1 translation elongation factor Ts [Borreliella burgdorferi 64b]EEH31311.1 translation elongation factor Ts [Borreliella burgdorferi Bol26]MCD2378525.1 translation elongation factor Ts [Borreliella burgdorferi]MCD2379404.1 translation elongation factor Ts [Borreliella burgdorferi]